MFPFHLMYKSQFYLLLFRCLILLNTDFLCIILIKYSAMDLASRHCHIDTGIYRSSIYCSAMWQTCILNMGMLDSKLILLRHDASSLFSRKWTWNDSKQKFETFMYLFEGKCKLFFYHIYIYTHTHF